MSISEDKVQEKIHQEINENLDARKTELNGDVLKNKEDNNATNTHIESQTLRELQDIILSAIEERKGIDIEMYQDLKYKISYKFVFLVQSSSSRNGMSIAENVMERLREYGMSSKIEGAIEGKWIFIQHGDLFAVSILTEEAEGYYKLRNLYRSRRKVNPVAETQEEIEL